MSLVATRRTLHILFLMGIAGAVAVAQETWVPAAAIIPLLGMVGFGLLEVLLPMPKWARRTIDGQGLMLRKDEADVTVHMGFCVMPYNLTVKERLPDGLNVKAGSQRQVRIMKESLRDGKFTMMEGGYTLEAVRRGDWDLGPCRVTRTSILGLFERQVDLPATTQTTVLPVTAQQHGMKLQPKTLVPEGIPTHTKRRGAGDTFYALREFQAGDSISDVNWKATARHGKPITNEFLPDEPARYLIYLDCRAFGAEKGKEDAFERTLELGGALVEGLFGAHAHVGIVLLAYKTQFKVPAGGAVHQGKVRQMILSAQPGEEAPLLPTVEAGAPHLPRRCGAILVTPNIYEPTLQQTLTFLRAHHGSVLLLVPGFPEPDTYRDAPERTAGALLNADQAAVLADLNHVTDGAAQWAPDSDIAVTLGQLGLIGVRR